MNSNFTFTETTHWIRDARLDPHGYNQTIIARKTFTAESGRKAVIRVTADSFYRLFLNGHWVQDGSPRAYPEHYLFDEIEVTNLLKNGENRIEIIARYYGVGTMKQICTQAGLLAQLDIQTASGTISIGTDKSWQTAPAKAWQARTPKIGCQMEPFESYDARLATELQFEPAFEAYPAHDAPWKDLRASTTLPLTRIPREAKLIKTRLVKKQPQHWSVPVTRLCHPGRIEMNRKTGRPLALAGTLQLEKKTAFDFRSSEWTVFIDGTLRDKDSTVLFRGQHEVLFFVRNFFGHHDKDLSFPFRDQSVDKWQALVFPELNYAGNELVWDWFSEPAADTAEENWQRQQSEFAAEPLDQLIEKYAVPVIGENLFYEDPDAAFKNRQPMQEIHTERIHLIPPVEGDIERCFDFGEETVGYFTFELEASAGTVIDLNAVEYIRDDGVIQHTDKNRNGLRYIAAEGNNRFTSLKRRGGRYLFITLRNQTGPVTLRKIGIIESTAPVKKQPPLNSGNEELDRIRRLCERTLQLCMEDTFTDCPLYEQVCWIGDARNEARYAYRTFGDTRVARRTLELGAQSLERYPIVGAQIPSAWDCLLPAWSFLWGIAVKEHFEFTRDLDSLQTFMPSVRKNMEGALSFIDPATGLFRARFWNLLDWADIDHEHEIVMHNSLLLVGALQAAILCAEALGEKSGALETARLKLIESINRWWDADKQAYPDSIHADGTPSPKTCQHTCALALMFDIAPDEARPALLRHLLDKPAAMTRAGSPFALQFVFEALEKHGQHDAVIQQIRAGYGPMLEAGATTAWEMFAGSSFDNGDFPTRSHCHAWSAAPLLFLP